MPFKPLLLLVSGLALGCTHYATWHEFARSPGYRVPPALAVVVSQSDAVRAADDGGFVDTTVLVVSKDLQKSGSECHVLDASEHPPPPPRVDLSFVGWKPGSGTVRDFTHGIAGEAEIVVEVAALAPDGAVALKGRVDGVEVGYNESPREAAEATGHSIARALTDAKWDPRPPPNLDTSLP